MLLLSPWCQAEPGDTQQARQTRPDSLRLCVDHFPPRQVLNEDGSWSGHSIEIVRELADYLKVPLLISNNTPFPRCLLDMQEGEADLMVGLRKNPERDAYMQLMPYSIAATSAFFSRADSNIQVQALSDLQGRIIGAVRGFTYTEGFESVRDHLNLVEVHAIEAGFGMLKRKRIDLMMATDYLGELVINKPEFKGLFIAQPLTLTTEAPVYIGLSRHSPAYGFAPRIEKAVEHLREQGRFDKILQQSKTALKGHSVNQ
ncbi:transporter substrate-binding domain-containing protein [Lacimicrobium sp. SS2-24]|uniref:substrate-binding periplasmic protein n=1 Tax=Lacimicrobium sp. SS2-24 TaxID=2005569 RepID=UPI00143C4993|nr:transporter substrate-binding domain-containing protein [Lacimicrobium sp. SS2-24]